MEAVPLLIFLTLFGFAEGIYDANIWASMYDVVHPSRRATMLGLANMIGWLGAGVATVGTGIVITRLHMTYGQVLSATASIYAVVAVLLIVAGAVFAPRDIQHAPSGRGAGRVTARTANVGVINWQRQPRRGRAVIIAGQPTGQQVGFAIAELVLEGRHVIVLAVVLRAARVGDEPLEPVDAAVTGQTRSRAFFASAFLSSRRRESSDNRRNWRKVCLCRVPRSQRSFGLCRRGPSVRAVWSDRPDWAASNSTSAVEALLVGRIVQQGLVGLRPVGHFAVIEQVLGALSCRRRCEAARNDS